MSLLPFCSRDIRYKSPLGAVKEGQPVTLRLLLHPDARCEQAWLLLRRDDVRDAQRLELSRTEDREGYHCFTVTFTPTEGLYFYTFAYNGGTGFYEITRFSGGQGQLSPEGEAWQLTVYTADFTTPDWFKGGVMYQIFPDRFARAGNIGKPYADRWYREDWGGTPAWRWDAESRQNGHFLSNDYFGGNLKGITQKLPYLAELGVTCLYLNPIFEAHSNHRYNTADYFRIDPTLGTEEDLRTLCVQAKSHGIKIILDGVFSHTGDDSVYFNRTGRYGEGGAYRDPNSPYTPWYKFEQWPEKYHSWWGIDTLPEVVEETPDYLEFICGENGVLRYWLRCGIDGWRLDVADELPDVFLDAVRAAIKAENPDALLLGEVWEDATTKISYGARRRFLRGRQLDSVMNYPFADAILGFVGTGKAEVFLEHVSDLVENYPPEALHCLMNHVGTHDTPRVLTVLGGEPQSTHDRAWQAQQVLSDMERAKGIRLLKIAAVLQFTLPGVPCIYYGDEAGMSGYGDPFNRGCFPWGQENLGLTEHYRRLAHIRRTSSAFQTGDFLPVLAQDSLVAFRRKDEKEDILICVNAGEAPIPLPIAPEWNQATLLMGSPPLANTLVVPGKNACILKI